MPLGGAQKRVKGEKRGRGGRRRQSPPEPGAGRTAAEGGAWQGPRSSAHGRRSWASAEARGVSAGGATPERRPAARPPGRPPPLGGSEVPSWGPGVEEGAAGRRPQPRLSRDARVLSAAGGLPRDAAAEPEVELQGR